MCGQNIEPKDAGSRPAQEMPADKNRILLVDDEKSIRQVFGQILSFKLPHHRIDVAENGAEAVESFRALHHGLVIMDLRMPVMDGVTAFREIRKICQTEDWEMPSVIFCTGFNASEEVRKIVAGDPAHCLLCKPVTQHLLMNSVTARLG